MPAQPDHGNRPVLKIETGNDQTVVLLQNHFRIPRLIAQVVSNRGVETVAEAERFLFPKIEYLSDPMALPDIHAGVDRIVTAVKAGERIGLFGDYDADGITSTALMINFLTQAGGLIEHYLPKREEGYGLTVEAVRLLKERGIDLLVCLDCGSTSTEEISAAREMGMDVLVIDHHEMTEERPAALALINPKRRDSSFPTRELAACGVTFFFLLALRRGLHKAGVQSAHINLKRELDLVALGTIADMAPLIGDNRILVKFGLEMMEKRPRTWMKTFMKRDFMKKGRLNDYVLNFLIIPRINAAGRVSDPEAALSFLISKDDDESERLLLALDAANRERQNIEEGILRQALSIIERDGLKKKASLVLFDDTWSVGVIGIAAQKLAESLGKPSIILTRVDGVIKGSARSIPGLDLHHTIASLAPLLLKFGGHKYACGISLDEENLHPFRTQFESRVNQFLKEYTREVRVDGIMEFAELTGKFVHYLDMLSPFGVGNPRPVFLLSPSSVSVNNRFVKLTDSENRIWHGFLRKPANIGEMTRVKVVASPSIRQEMGEEFINLQIREFVSDV